MISTDFHNTCVDIFSNTDDENERRIRCDLCGIDFSFAYSYYLVCGKIVEDMKSDLVIPIKWNTSFSSKDNFYLNLTYTELDGQTLTINENTSNIPWYLISESLIYVITRNQYGLSMGLRPDILINENTLDEKAKNIIGMFNKMILDIENKNKE